jgi:hypothetical protein
MRTRAFGSAPALPKRPNLSAVRSVTAAAGAAAARRQARGTAVRRKRVMAIPLSGPPRAVHPARLFLLTDAAQAVYGPVGRLAMKPIAPVVLLLLAAVSGARAQVSCDDPDNLCTGDPTRASWTTSR